MGKNDISSRLAPARKQMKQASLNRQLVNQKSAGMPSSSSARCAQVTYPSCSRRRSGRRLKDRDGSVGTQADQGVP